MPVPVSITALSTTPASNSPPGSESPILADDYLRTQAAFIAQLRDGSAFSGTVAAPTAFRQGGATQGAVGTLTASGSGATANASWDDVVIDGSSNVGVSILSGAASSGAVAFGDTGNSVAGSLRYNHSTDQMTVVANGSTRVTIGDAGLTCGSGLYAFNATQGFIGARASGGSGATVSASYDEIVVDSGGTSSGLSFLGPANATQAVIFGDVDNVTQGRVQYSHTADTLQLWGSGTERMRLTFSQVQAGAGSSTAAPVYSTIANPASGVHLDTFANAVQLVSNAKPLVSCYDNGSVVLGQEGVGDLARSATVGFVSVRTMAGSPTSTLGVASGVTEMIVDTTNSRLYFNIGGTWKYAALV